MFHYYPFHLSVITTDPLNIFCIYASISNLRVSSQEFFEQILVSDKTGLHHFKCIPAIKFSVLLFLNQSLFYLGKHFRPAFGNFTPTTKPWNYVKENLEYFRVHNNFIAQTLTTYTYIHARAHTDNILYKKLNPNVNMDAYCGLYRTLQSS